MKVLVTGSSGHLGEALMIILKARNIEVVGIDILPSAHTNLAGSITNRNFVRQSMNGITDILHTATLHKPHVVTHSRQQFVDTPDDEPSIAAMYADDNLKANEYLYRRVDIEDVVNAHLLAMEKAPEIGFGKYIISATSPFEKNDLTLLNRNAFQVVKTHYPDFEERYAKKGWIMLPTIGRVYVNQKARKELGWLPKYDFRYILDKLKTGKGFKSVLTEQIGSKGYHRK